MGKIQSFLWPIKNEETLKFIGLTFLLFLAMASVEAASRSVDLAVAASNWRQHDVEFWGYMGSISAIFLIFLYIYLCNFFRQHLLFLILVVPFLLFFLLASLFPSLISGAQAPLLSLYVTIAGVWELLLVFVFVWQFINQVTTVEQASRFYMLFTFLNLVLFAAIYQEFYSLVDYLLFVYPQSFDESQVHLWLSWILGTLMVILFAGMRKALVLDEERDEECVLGFWESIHKIFMSKYIQIFIVIVLLQALLQGLFFHIFWKTVNVIFSQDDNMNTFISIYTPLIVFAMAFSIFVFKKTIYDLGWKKSALLGPFVYATALPILLMIYYLEPEPTPFMVFLLTLFQSLIFTLGVHLYFATKQMLYIPLERELRVKGKAVIDGVVDGLVILGIGFLLESLNRGEIQNEHLFLSAVILILAFMWAGAVFKMGPLYKAAVEKHEINIV